MSSVRRFISALFGFEGARRKTSDADFVPPRLGPNAEQEQGGGFGGSAAESLVAASTYELNNNELLDGGVESDIDAVVRTGVTLVEPMTGVPGADAAIREVWEIACAAADVSRTRTLGELQALYRRELWRAGECFVRTVYAPPINGFPGGPAIEIVPSERVPRSLTGTVPDGFEGAGNRVRGGIELNDSGQIVAVWVLKDHPEDASPWGGFAGWNVAGLGAFDPAVVRRVPSGEIACRFYQRRAAQLRGVPPLCSVLNTVRQERSYTDASMTTATTAARLGIFMETPNQEAFITRGGSVPPLAVNAAGQPAVSFGKGAQMFFVAAGTKLLGTMAPTIVGPAFEGVIKAMTRRLSRVLRRTASQVSGDYEQNNFAGARMAQLDTSKGDERAQADVWSMTLPYYRAVVLSAFLAGKLPDVTRQVVAQWMATPMGFDRLYAVSVTAPGQGYANPEQEARANASDVALGVKSRVEVCQERGVRYTDVIAENVRYEVFERDARAKAGLASRADASVDVSRGTPSQSDKEAAQDDQRRQRSLKIAGGAV